MKYKKLIIAGIIILILGLGITGYFTIKKILQPKKTHYHAGFVVFKDNKKIDFSGFQYMNVKPCSLNQKGDDSDADIQLEKAHLHDEIGDVVHIERQSALWKDLFTNIHFPIDYNNTTGYINGKKVANYQDQKIQSYGSLVVLIGNNNEQVINQAVTKKHIQDVEKKSGSCSE